MTRRHATSALICLLASAVLVAGCGDSDSATSAENTPAPSESDFPATDGKTLREVVDDASSESELVVTPDALAFDEGQNRYPFIVTNPDRTQVEDAEVAIYLAKGKDSTEALEQPAMGPYPAEIESLATKPAYRARTTTENPDAAKVVYAADIDLPGDGEWQVTALIRQGDGVSAVTLPGVAAAKYRGIPQVGEKAPIMQTPTSADVNGYLKDITTRLPPDSQNEVDYGDVLGKEPVILLFATTPRFCPERVCAPVVDVAEQVKAEYGDDAAFIHMEPYKDNRAENGFREEMGTFGLPSEPWLFAIDSDGVVKAKIEGAFGVNRLTEVVEEVAG